MRPFLSDDAPLRVGVLGGWFRDDADPAVLAAVDTAVDTLGACRTPVELAEARIARFGAFATTAAEGGEPAPAGAARSTRCIRRRYP